MKLKSIITLALAAALCFSLSACGGNKAEDVAIKGTEKTDDIANGTEKTDDVAKETEKPEEAVIRIGLNGEENVIWTSVRDRLAKEGIKLEFVFFSDYLIPNTALADGELDANAFQTEIFFENFLSNSDADLSILGYTILAPMGIYPGNVDSLDKIQENGRIAIPNDPSNGGRALLLLSEAGLIKLNEDAGLLPTIKDIVENPKNLEIVEMTAGLIPGAMDEFDVACINNNYALLAGLSLLDDSIFYENPEWEYVKSYYNIIACQTSDLNKPELLKLKEVYQSEETRANIDAVYNGMAIPIF